MKKIFFISLTLLSFHAKAQYLFPVKLTDCVADKFCLDCGDTKAGIAKEDWDQLLEKMNRESDLQDISGTARFQVLVDTNGSACVLSHTDKSGSPVTLKIIETLNRFKQWQPALKAGKAEEKSSITLILSIKDNRINGQVERVDIEAFRKSFDRPKDPEIFNKTYAYTNAHLGQYRITTWNSKNSGLTDNMNDHITIDKNGLIWLTADNDLLTFDGKTFKKVTGDIPAGEQRFSVQAVATDNNNTKWIYASNCIYSYNNKKWQKHDSLETGMPYVYDIINNPKTGEVFFFSDKGLTIYKAGKWSNMNKEKFPDLPSDRVYYAKRDAKNRIWIGTFSGTAMIGTDHKITNFENGNSILKGKCITSMDEDENGNIYFSLYEFDRKERGKINNDEGIAVLYKDGTFKQFTTDNSGMPFNHTGEVLYDKKERVLWMITDRAGLVRYDLKKGWENYHNKNSDIPTSHITSMAFDAKGNLYLATRQGLVKVEKK